MQHPGGASVVLGSAMLFPAPAANALLRAGLGWAGLAEPGRQEGGVGMHWLRTCPDLVLVPCWETDLQLHLGWLYGLVSSAVPICHKHNVLHSALAARVGVMGCGHRKAQQAGQSFMDLGERGPF